MNYRLRHKFTSITICKVTCKKRICKTTICICIWRSVNVDMLYDIDTRRNKRLIIEIRQKNTQNICIHSTFIINYAVFIRYFKCTECQLFLTCYGPYNMASFRMVSQYFVIFNFEVHRQLSFGCSDHLDNLYNFNFVHLWS